MPRAARALWIVTIVYWCGLYAVTHTPIVPLRVVPVTDKTAHFVSYALLATALFLALHLSRRRPVARTAMLTLTILLAYGAFDELTQIPVGRSCELADWYADAAGAAAAVVVMTLLVRDPVSS